MDWFRALELDNWFLANIVSWVFLLWSGLVAFSYWMKQLKTFNDNKEDKV